MNFVKRLTLILSAIAFCLGLFVVSADAQRRGSWNRRSDDRWERRDQRRWRSGNYRNWQNRGNGRALGRYRNNRLTPREYWRLQQQRSRIYRTRSRYYNNDGYISDRERRRLQRRYMQYRRNVIRDRRDW